MSIKGQTPAAGTPSQAPETMSGQMSGAFTRAQENQRNNNGDQGAQRQSTGFSFRNMGGLARTAMGRSPASEVLSKLNKAISGVYAENIDKSFEVTTIPLDMNQTSTLSVSALIVAMRDKQNPNLGVAFHTLIVEASAEALPPKFENINGQNTEIIRATGDAWNDTMINEVTAVVQRQFPQSTLLNAEACVVPREFNVNDTDAVFKLAANAAFAVSSELETNAPGFQDLNLSNAERDSNLTVRPTFGNAEVADATGLPVRADLRVDFQAAPTNRGGQQQMPERVSTVAHIDGFLDLVWDPAAPVTNMYYAQQQQSFQRYAVRFVATTLESTNLLTLPAQLLALLPALSLREGNAWVQAFRQQGFGGEIDLHDIGAVGIEANFENNASGFGTRIDTKADSFKPEHLHKLVASTIKPGLILSLDVPECGASTWYNGVFAAAAEGNPRANAAIIEAANYLTNGAFSKYFPENGRVCIDENNRVHMGYYTDKNGRHDIREIDYLAVMNLVGEKDPQIIRDWSDTFLRTDYPLNLRLAARKRIITALANDVTITGFARRVTFESAFVEALAKAAAEAGLTMTTISAYADLGSYERATASFVGGAMLSGDGQTGLFNRGGFGQGSTLGGRGNFGNFGRRWG